MRTKSQVIDKFAARDDHGNEYTVIEYQELLEDTATHCSLLWIPGMRELRLEDGSLVNEVDENTFEIVGRSNIVIKRV